MAETLPRRLRKSAVDAVNTTLLRAAGTTSGQADARRELVWWTETRMRSLRARNFKVSRASALSFSPNDYVELVPVEVPAPGPGEVTVRTAVSAVNVGTEKAQYLRKTTPPPNERTHPGSSLSGEVVAVGPGEDRLRVGQRVAVTRGLHASLVTVDADAVVALPDAVADADAALLWLAMVAQQGVELARVAPGERCGVIGVGIIGSLALRFVQAAGAVPAIAFARTESKRDLALAGGAAEFRTLDDAGRGPDGPGLPVVFEVTGDPQALAFAVDVAAPGGRIVLLGSSRGVTRDAPVAAIREKGLTLVGAHIDTVARAAGRLDRAPDAPFQSAAGRALERREAERFLARVARGELRLDGLVTRTVDPRQAAVLYRDIVADRSIVGAAIDWTRLPDPDRMSRSSFLRPPVLTGRGMAFGGPSMAARESRRSAAAVPDPFAGATGDLRIGLLGCGDIAVHNAGAIAAAPNARITACFDPVAALAEEIASAHGAEAVRNQAELVEHPQVDAVFIAVPHHLHAPMALAAIAAGKHVIVEKPLAVDVASAQSIVDAGEAAGLVVSTCFPQRYDPAVQFCRELLESGAIGELGGTLVRVLMDKSPSYWLGGYSGRAQSTWRSSLAQAGGGVLLMNACHYVDVIRYLAGVDVTSVSALSSTVDGDVEVEDSITAAMAYRNGALGSVVASSAVRGTTHTEVQLWGREGHVVLEPEGRFYSLRNAVDGRVARWRSFPELPGVNTRGVYVSRLASAITRGEEPEISGRDGLAVQILVEAAYISAAERRAVETAEFEAGVPA